MLPKWSQALEVVSKLRHRATQFPHSSDCRVDTESDVESFWQLQALNYSCAQGDTLFKTLLFASYIHIKKRGGLITPAS